MIDETRKTLFMGEIKTISCSKAVELLFNVFSQEEGTARCGRRELFFLHQYPKWHSLPFAGWKSRGNHRKWLFKVALNNNNKLEIYFNNPQNPEATEAIDASSVRSSAPLSCLAVALDGSFPFFSRSKTLFLRSAEMIYLWAEKSLESGERLGWLATRVVLVDCGLWLCSTMLNSAGFAHRLSRFSPELSQLIKPCCTSCADFISPVIFFPLLAAHRSAWQKSAQAHTWRVNRVSLPVDFAWVASPPALILSWLSTVDSGYLANSVQLLVPLSALFIPRRVTPQTGWAIT